MFSTFNKNHMRKLIILISSTGLMAYLYNMFGDFYRMKYLDTLGFDPTLFPEKPYQVIDWAYLSSLELGSRVFVLFQGYPLLLFSLLSISLYCLIMFLFRGLRDNKWPRLTNRLKGILPSSDVEKDMWTVALVIMVIMVALFFWLLIPHMAIITGKNVGEEMLAVYKKSLCLSEGEHWNRCVEFSTSHIHSGEPLPDKVVGRIVVKHENLVGLMTEQGPLTMTMPPALYFTTKTNTCLGKVCDKH